MLALRYVYVLALVVWLGGMVVLGAIVAPTTFQVLQAREPVTGRALAGELFGTIIARFFAIGEEMENTGRQVLRRHAARFAFGLAFMTWIMSAAAFTLAEDVGDGRRVHSFFGALWWSSATITTVGYGDFYPVTPGGEVVATIMIFAGVALISIFTAWAASTFMATPASDSSPAPGQSGSVPEDAPENATAIIADLKARLDQLEALVGADSAKP
mgnify:CR=1 FL=1